MNSWWPDYVELSADVEPARWVSDSLQPWARDGLTLASLLPPGFDAYARVLHPIDAEDGTSSWEHVAEARGIDLTAETRFAELQAGEANPSLASPLEGELPEEQGRILAGVLEGFTTTESECWFCVWEGWGSLGPESGQYLVVARDLVVARGRIRPSLSGLWPRRFRRSSRQARKFDKETAHLGRVQIPGRRYFLFHGDVSAASRPFSLDKWGPRPSMWWPEDRAWFVHTEIDACSTYVAGSRACVDACLKDARLEVLETTYTSRFAG